MQSLVLITGTGLLAGMLTGVLRRYALGCSLLDVPNARSSHKVPTPRGGGAAIVLSVSLALPVLAWLDVLESADLWALLGAGWLVAIVGFLDDHGHIAARWRLLAHFVAAVWGLYWLGGGPAVSLPGRGIELGWLGGGLTAIYLVWMLNLYNFMDGIDGLASIEAICVCFGAVLVHFLVEPGASVVLPLLVAAAVAGFLCWNFPPAKIFMGDVGSGFLGITLGILSLQAAAVSSPLFWSWLVLLGVFVVDATWTLMRRLVRGERVYEAHRSHAYQHAARAFGAHRPVTLGATAINLLWLLPIAIAIGKRALDPFSGLALAYGPLLVLAIYFRAGLPEAVRHE